MDSDSMVTPAELALESSYSDAVGWPMLAAYWLTTGYDSEHLRRLASLSTAEARNVSVAEMREVLRSLDVPIASEAELQRRCAAALAAVQNDLDATGFEQFQMHARPTYDSSDSIRPRFVAAFANGDYTINAEALYPDIDEDDLLANAANAVSDTIIDVWLTSWPECNVHFGPPLAARTLKKPAQPAGVYWYCPNGEHVVARVGELSSDVASTRGAPSRPLQA